MCKPIHSEIRAKCFSSSILTFVSRKLCPLKVHLHFHVPPRDGGALDPQQSCFPHHQHNARNQTNIVMRLVVFLAARTFSLHGKKLPHFHGFFTLRMKLPHSRDTQKTANEALSHFGLRFFPSRCR